MERAGKIDVLPLDLARVARPRHCTKPRFVGLDLAGNGTLDRLRRIKQSRCLRLKRVNVRAVLIDADTVEEHVGVCDAEHRADRDANVKVCLCIRNRRVRPSVILHGHRVESAFRHGKANAVLRENWRCAGWPVRVV